MAYFDGIDDQQLTPDQEAENRRRMLGMLAGAGRTSVLGNRPPEPSPIMNSSQPTMPAPRMTSTAPPSLDPTFAPKPPVLGATAQPVRPNVMPQRSDFPEGPGLPTWKKVLGLGLSALAGPQRAGPLAEQILNKPRLDADRQYNQATTDWERSQTDAARAATTNEANARADSLRNPKPEKPEGLTNQEAQAVEDLVAQGVKRVDAIGQVKAAGQKPPNPTFEEQAYTEWAAVQKAAGKPYDRMTFSKEKAAATQKPEQPPKPQQMLGVTPDGKVIELRPGMALPPGTKSLGGELSITGKTEQGEEAGKSAVSYANDYLTGKQWTGPGDEALMEKFFEMAKPSSGFRMTQAQIEMLQRSRDLMGGITAKAKHTFTPEAPWFSDTQRQQIVKTMNDLAKSRSAVKPGAQDQPIELERGPDGKLKLKNATK